MHQPTLFKSFFMGGFECSSHRRSDSRRLDLLARGAHEIGDQCIVVVVLDDDEITAFASAAVRASCAAGSRRSC